MSDTNQGLPGSPTAVPAWDAAVRPNDEEEAEIRRIVSSLDGRLTEAERRIERVLARLGVS